MAYITDENGNYKRTVRCSYCYEKGHNKSACPTRKKDLKKTVISRKKALKANDYESDWHRQHDERHLQLAKKELRKMETRGQNRKCGFCGEEGHTRRTCSHRKQKVADALARTLDIRKRICERMMADGFGPGSLVQLKSDWIQQDLNNLAVITHISFEDIQPHHVVSENSYYYGCEAIHYKYVVPREDNWSKTEILGGRCYIPADYMNVDNLPEQAWFRNPNNTTCELMSGVSVSEDLYLTEAAYGDKKKVEKWVIDNIVDPK